MRRPWVFLVLTLGLLLSLAWPAHELYAIGAGGPRALPADTETRQGFDALLGAFGAGEATPISIVIRNPNANGAWDPSTLEAVYQITRRLQDDPRVQRVQSLVSLVPAGTSLDQFKAIKPEQLQANPQRSEE